MHNGGRRYVRKKRAQCPPSHARSRSIFMWLMRACICVTYVYTIYMNATVRVRVRWWLIHGHAHNARIPQHRHTRAVERMAVHRVQCTRAPRRAFKNAAASRVVLWALEDHARTALFHAHSNTHMCEFCAERDAQCVLSLSLSFSRSLSLAPISLFVGVLGTRNGVKDGYFFKQFVGFAFILVLVVAFCRKFGIIFYSPFIISLINSLFHNLQVHQ